MTILAGDLKIFKSDTMNDTEQGGGARTGSVVIDGLSNNIFPDISTIDRVAGVVRMAKVFPTVYTQNNDVYRGAHFILSKMPADKKIGVNLFSRGDWFDRRPEARSRIENYLAKGAVYQGFLLDTQWQDSKVVTLFQSESAPLPGIGDVLYLSQNDENEFQFIKIVELNHSIATFTDQTGSFKRRIVQLKITEGLNYDFVGAQISRIDTITPDAAVRNTVVANAAKYYSATTLKNSVLSGDVALSVESVYSQIVPSSAQPLAILDADVTGTTTSLFDSSAGASSVVISTVFSANSSFYVGSPYLPGSLSIPVNGGEIVDDGGNLKIGSIVIGTANYIEGSFTFLADAPTYAGTKTVSFTPAAAPARVADTDMIYVTAANRSNVWTGNIQPAPLPGSMQVSFRALGVWYTLYDDGNGALLAQESGIGSGGINYATGSWNLTTAALPDVDSAVISSWGKAARYYNRSDITPDPLMIKFELANQGVANATFSISWNDGTDRTATADVVGNISGDAVGFINHGAGTGYFSPNTLPLGGTTFTFNYDTGVPKSQIFNNPALSGSNITLNISENNLLPNSVEVRWGSSLTPIDFEVAWWQKNQPLSGNSAAIDDGNGALINVNGSEIAGSSVDYVNGVLTFNTSIGLQYKERRYNYINKGVTVLGNGVISHKQFPVKIFTGYADVTGSAPLASGSNVEVLYRTADSITNQTETLTLSSIELDLSNGFDETVIPGSLRFTLGNDVFVDRNGLLYHSVDPTNNAGIYAGTFDYSTGNAVINSWDTGAANTVSLQSLSTEAGRVGVSEISLRIPHSPVNVDSVTFRCVTESGEALVITPESSGAIDHPSAQGYMNFDAGIAQIVFGSLVVAAGNEGEDWYDSDLVDDNGNIFKSISVYADTLLYNATSVTYLPLDPDLLKLNPVRLPQDGRVPFFEVGDIVVALHDQVTTGTYSNGQQVNLGRTRISRLTVRDAANQEILASRYSADLELGTLQWLDVSGVSQPITITDRIEDMSMLTDVQINGAMKLSQPLTHDFPADETVLSNIVPLSDLFARTSIPFDQQSWTDEWSDTRIGSETTAQFNHSLYPIEVDNASAIEEDWLILFRSPTIVDVIGRNVGQILTGVVITSDINPVNPSTSQSYFSINNQAWGGGWSSGNCLRFKTFGAGAPVWIIQSIGQGQATDDDYSFCVEFRGDIDTE